MEGIIVIIGLVVYILQLINNAHQKQLKEKSTSEREKPSVLEEWLNELEQASNASPAPSLPQTTTITPAKPAVAPKSQLDNFLKGRKFYDSEIPKTETFKESGAYFDQKAIDYDKSAQDYDITARDLDLVHFDEQDFESHTFGNHAVKLEAAQTITKDVPQSKKSQHLRSLFHDQKHVRNAFLMSEILSKPKSQRSN